VIPLLCAGLSTQAQAPLRLPALGDGAEWGLGEERNLGDSIMAQVWRDPDVIEDPILLQYVQDLWRPILQAAKNRGELSSELDERFAWELVLIKDRSVNAFALPGGYLGVHLGLIAVASNRDELAAVLAHELSHVTQRHIARMLAQQSRATPLIIGSMLLGVLAASRSPDAAGALMVGGQAAAMQNQLSFSRDMEREADRVGFGLMAPAGFQSQGAITLFEKLIQAARLNDSGAYPYLRSHPMSTERMADMAARAHQLGPNDKAPGPDVLHAMLSARARALTDLSSDAQRKFILDAQERKAQASPDNVTALAALYAGVVAHLKARQFDQALSLLALLRGPLKGQSQAMDQLAWLSADAHLQQGRASAALDDLASVSPASSALRPHKMLLAQALLASNKPENIRQAVMVLDVWLGKTPRDALAWDLSGQALLKNEQLLRGLRAQAESRAVQYDYVAAIDRLLAAQDAARVMARAGSLSRPDEFDAAIIDTRLRQLRALRREQTLQR
jgi:predicted Zn-dependent protease